MVERIEISKLHNQYSYVIDIPKGDTVSILTGPNGYGKTTILNILSHLLRCNFWYFFFIKFEKITVYTSNIYPRQEGAKCKLVVECTKSKDSEDERRDDEKSRVIAVRIVEELDDKEKYIVSLVLTHDYIKNLVKIYAKEYQPLGDTSEEDLLEDFYNCEKDDFIGVLGDAKTMQMLFEQSFNCLFIQQQRTFHRLRGQYRFSPDRYYRRETSVAEIEHIARSLRRAFYNSRDVYTQESQKMDSTLINRLLNGDVVSLTAEQCKERLGGLKEKIEQYKDFGLVVSDLDVDLDADFSGKESILTTFISDLEKKIQVYSGFYDKLSLFKKVLDNKVLSNKSLKFNANHGFSVIASNGDDIPLDKLSSGEQNLLIIYYRIIFEMPKGGLLLIDEPENSLHLAWTKTLLEDYIDMTKMLGCHVIVATHSPSFIAGNWNLVSDLYQLSTAAE